MLEGMAKIKWKQAAIDEIVRDYGDPPAELVVVDSAADFIGLSDQKLDEKIDWFRTKFLGRGWENCLPDKGDKLKARLRLMEEEQDRRKRLRDNAVDQPERNVAAEGRRAGGPLGEPSPRTSSSVFFSCFYNKLETENTCSSAFTEELRFCRGNFNSSKQSKPSSVHPGRLSSLRLRPSSKGTPVISGSQRSIDKYYADNVAARFSSQNTHGCMGRREEWRNHVSSQLMPSKNVNMQDDVVVLDEEDAEIIHSIDDEDDDNDMSDVRIYYPTRDHADCVEICYSDIKCLDPESYLSSTIMNFYIQYLQKPMLSTGRSKGEYHFFNTYFYSKLLESLSSKSDIRSQLPKLRRWFKGVNLFQKAYIFLPVHGSLHWSLVIICIPVMEDESGPIVLHLDSLRLHDSNIIFRNIERYLIAEWEHMRKIQGPYPPNLPISEETWRDLPNKITKRRIMVPQQENEYDCGLFVLYFMERFIMEAPDRARKQDLDMFGNRWFLAEEASGLRKRLRELLMEEFENARLNEINEETLLSSTSSSEAG